MEVERVRYERLRLVCKKALEQLIKKGLDMDRLVECFPEVAKTQKGLSQLQTARAQIVKFWYTSSMAEFDLIFKARDMENKLNELDEIIQLGYHRMETSSEPPVMICDLSPEQILEATARSDQNLIHALNLIYDQLLLDNKQLVDEISNVTKQALDVKSDIDKSVDLIRKSVETLGNDDVDMNIDELLDAI